jgi:hypothetical protein
MRIDHVFDRHRASHRRLLAHQRGRRTQRKARGAPNRFQGRGTHGALLHHAIEGVEMFLLLCRHAADRPHILR